MEPAKTLIETCNFQPLGLGIPLQQLWRKGPLCPAFWQNEVHVWKVDLSVPWSELHDKAMAATDRQQAMRFRFALDRHRFSVARASLRMILSRYLNRNPATIDFERGAHGKPHLADSDDNRGLRFNVSHSNQLALIAVARDREVGIDIEFRKDDFGTYEVADRFFSAAEINQLKSVSDELRVEAFFNCWTRKEAYIKARGEGLSMPLDEFEVSLVPGTSAELISNVREPQEVERWRFEDLYAAPGFAAALAVERGFSRLLLWEFV